MHSSSTAEALQRLVSAFPPEVQGAVWAQLADCLVGVVCQRLRYRPDLGIRVPECEVLMGSTPVRSLVRQGFFFKLPSAIETGAADGSWTFTRYAEWLNRKTDWHLPSPAEEAPAELPPAPVPSLRVNPPAGPEPLPRPPPPRPKRVARDDAPPGPAPAEDGVFVIQEEQDELLDIIRQLERGGSGSSE
ncbi:hypothetical protein JQX13_29350 [Archangium violaceum]|uniref:hypothetical protein n=1 Tax=Archangium violaceum TaxID=83451 RepID=UPI00193B0D1D|nr:hypothetical protein [Archangium violaceum]QRK04364.1 hypothetical protein JQX13_29350 [Archangium violaceum]